MKCTKSGASAIVAGKEFHAGTVLGKKLYLNVSELIKYCRSFFEWSALVLVLAGDRYSSAGMSTRSFVCFFPQKIANQYKM